MWVGEHWGWGSRGGGGRCVYCDRDIKPYCTKTYKSNGSVLTWIFSLSYTLIQISFFTYSHAGVYFIIYLCHGRVLKMMSSVVTFKLNLALNKDVQEKVFVDD